MATKLFFVGNGQAEEIKAIASLPGLMSAPSPLGMNDRQGRGLAQAFSASVFAYAAVMRKSRLMASVPLKVYRDDPDGNPEEVAHPLTDRGALGPGSTSKLRDLYCDLDIFGRAYLLKERGVLGATLTLTRLNPIAVSAVIEQGVKVRYEYKTNDYAPKFYALNEIIYLSTYDPANDDGGLSPLSVALSAAGLDAATMAQAVAFFRNGANLSGMLTTDGPMQPTDIERLESAWKRVYTGIQNAFKTFIAWGGIKWVPMGVPPKDLAMADVRQQVMNAICFVLQISPQLLSSDSTFANSKEARKAFYEDTAAPVLDLLADTLTGDPDIFKPGSREYAAFDMSVLPAMADDEKSKYERAAMALQTGGNLNEARAIIGAEPLEGDMGEQRYMIAGLQPVGNAPAPVAPIPAQPEPMEEEEPEIEDEEDDDMGEDDSEEIKATLAQWRELALSNVYPNYIAGTTSVKLATIAPALFDKISYDLGQCKNASDIRAVFERHWPRAVKASFSPPQAVRNAARRGLELREKWGRGGLSTQEAGAQGIGSGVARATNLANGDAVSLQTIRRMVSFFARHEKNKNGRHEDGGPSAGAIAWLLWGGDAGRRWAESVSNAQASKVVSGDTWKEFSSGAPSPVIMPQQLAALNALTAEIAAARKDLAREIGV